MTTRENLERTLHEQIPVSRAMQITVEQLDERSLTLVAPLAANHNHAGTAFAGSQYSLASLAGWALLRTILERHGVRAALVLGTGNIRYSRPLEGELRAVAALSAAAEDELLKRLGSGRTASLTLEIPLGEAQPPCATFSGAYVAKPL